MGAENSNQVLCNSIQCSLLPSHPSSPFIMSAASGSICFVCGNVCVMQEHIKKAVGILPLSSGVKVGLSDLGQILPGEQVNRSPAFNDIVRAKSDAHSQMFPL